MKLKLSLRLTKEEVPIVISVMKNHGWDLEDASWASGKYLQREQEELLEFPSDYYGYIEYQE